MKKILSLVLVLSLVLGSFSFAFAAEEPVNVGELLKEWGALTGDQNGNLNPEKELDRASMAAILVRLNGVEEEAKAFPFAPTFADADQITWGASTIAYVQGQGWMKGNEKNEFMPTRPIRLDEAVNTMLNVLGYSVSWSKVMESAEELGLLDNVNGKADQPVLRSEVFQLMYNTVHTPKMGEEAPLGVALGYPIVEEEKPAEELEVVSVTPIDVNKVEVKFNQAVDTEAATVRLMRGFANYNITIEWNEAKDTVVATSSLSKLFPADYTVVVEGLTEEALNLPVTFAAEVATKVEVATTEVDIANEAKIYFNVLNQYGTKFTTANTNALTVNVHETIADVTVALKTGSEKAASDKAAHSLMSTLTVTNAQNKLKAGDTFTVIAVYESVTTQASVRFVDAANLSNLSFGAVNPAGENTRVYVSQPGVTVDYQAFDQYGKAFELQSLSSIQFVSSNNNIVDASTFTLANKKITFNAGATAGTAVITAIYGSGQITQFNVVVEDASKPNAAVLTPPNVLLAAGEKAILDLVVYNQFGDVIPNDTLGGNIRFEATGGATFSINADKKLEGTVAQNTAFKVEVKRDSDNVVLASVTFAVEPLAVATTITNVNIPTLFEHTSTYNVARSNVTVLDQYGRVFTGGTVSLASSASNVVGVNGLELSAAAQGTSKLTVTVSGINKEVDVKVVPSTEIKTYTIADPGTIYGGASGASHDVAITLQGVDAQGNAVVLADNTPAFVTSSNTAVVGVVNLKSIRGAAAGTATLTAWLGGKQVATRTVTVSTEAPVATTVTIASSLAQGTAISTLVTVKDQYGKDIADAGVYFVNDAQQLSTHTLNAGTYTVKYVSATGVVQTRTVTVTAPPQP